MKGFTKEFIKICLVSGIFMAMSYFISIFLTNNILKFSIIILITIIMSWIIVKLNNTKKNTEVLDYISTIDKLDFNIPDDANMSEEFKNQITEVAKHIKQNLKTQVEISTEIFMVCEKLAILATESLESSEFIASSTEITDLNANKQSEMLIEISNLSQKIYNSMDTIDRDIIEKIQFISNAITDAQKGISEMKHIETRIIDYKQIVDKNSKKISDLKTYSDEVVSLVDMINKISNQTKMLSLNASIEAARAGEHGKGFSIVAMEVGKLATETEVVSKKIETEISKLQNEILNIYNEIEYEIIHMDKNCELIKETNEDFKSIINTLNLGKKSLEDIKNSTKDNGFMINDITSNINKITDFSKETTAQIASTTEQTIEQYNRSKYLNEVVEKISQNVLNMQQFVAGRVMEEKMLKQAYMVKDYFIKNTNVSDGAIKELMKTVGVDAVYITDSNGVVIDTSEKSAIGLNLYIADPSFQEFKTKKKEYIVTPIKKRFEDGQLYKFLTLTDEKGRLYEIGMALDSIIKDN